MLKSQLGAVSNKIVEQERSEPLAAALTISGGNGNNA